MSQPDPTPAAATTVESPAAASKGGVARVVMIAIGVGIMVAPGVVIALAWTPEAASPLILGALVGATSAMSAGQRWALLEVFLLLLAAPVAIVAGQVPTAGAAFMALLCLGAGLTAQWGMHGSFTMIPLVLAYPMIHPPALGELAIDRNASVYVLTLSLLMFTGALWMAVVVPLLARHRSLPALQPASRQDTLTYTVIITVLCSVNTFGVLTLNPSSQGAWLILTLIAVTQLGPMKSVRKTVYRVIGTVFGTAIAAGVAAAVPSGGLQLLVAMVCLVVALYFRTAHYWVYVTFLTPTVVLLSASGDVTATGESRVLYTVIAASQVVLASAIVFAYQHRRSQGESSSKPIRQEPIVDPAVTE